MMQKRIGLKLLEIKNQVNIMENILLKNFSNLSIISKFYDIASRQEAVIQKNNDDIKVWFYHCI